MNVTGFGFMSKLIFIIASAFLAMSESLRKRLDSGFDGCNVHSRNRVPSRFLLLNRVE